MTITHDSLQVPSARLRNVLAPGETIAWSASAERFRNYRIAAILAGFGFLLLIFGLLWPGFFLGSYILKLPSGIVPLLFCGIGSCIGLPFIYFSTKFFTTALKLCRLPPPIYAVTNNRIIILEDIVSAWPLASARGVSCDETHNGVGNITFDISGAESDEAPTFCRIPDARRVKCRLETLLPNSASA